MYLFYFVCMFCLNVFMCTTVGLVTVAVRRSCGTPWNWSKIDVSHHVDAENRTCVLSKSSCCFNYGAISPASSDKHV